MVFNNPFGVTSSGGAELVGTASYNASDEISGVTIATGLTDGVYRLQFRCDNWGLNGVSGGNTRMAFNFGGIDAGLDVAENGYDAQAGFVNGTALGDVQTNAQDYFAPHNTSGTGGEMIDVIIYLNTTGDCWVQGQAVKRATLGATGTSSLSTYFFGGVYRGTAHDKSAIGVSYFGGFLGATSRDFGDNTEIRLYKINSI